MHLMVTIEQLIVVFLLSKHNEIQNIKINMHEMGPVYGMTDIRQNVYIYVNILILCTN